MHCPENRGDGSYRTHIYIRFFVVINVYKNVVSEILSMRDYFFFALPDSHIQHISQRMQGWPNRNCDQLNSRLETKNKTLARNKFG